MSPITQPRQSSSSVTLTQQEPVAKPPDSPNKATDHGQKQPSPTMPGQEAQPGLSWIRKHVLLALYAMATFTDICQISGARMAVSPITEDLELPPAEGVWVINAYALSFAAFLLVAGRLADTFQVRVLFLLGLVGLGILCLVTSFITNKYGFFILRGISGLFGALIIPSAYRLTVITFPDSKEQKQKLALLSVASGLGNVIGLLIAGAVNWQWFFRVMTITCAITAIVAMFLLPAAEPKSSKSKFSWLALDPIGSILIMGSLGCFNLALTEVPAKGWGSAIFIAPFILSFILGLAFFIWEAYVRSDRAMLPPVIWKIPNAVIATLAIMIAFPFWATTQVQYANYYQEVGDWPTTRVAAAMVPQGIVAVTLGFAIRFIPFVVEKPRITIGTGSILIIGAYILLIFSDGGLGIDYWRFCLPAFSIGSGGAMIVYFASSINFISFCPPEMAGVAGSWTQVVTQTAGAVCLAVQAAIVKDINDWADSAAKSFYFMIAWTVVLCLQYLMFYRQPGTPSEEHERLRQRISESKKEREGNAV